MLLGYVTVEVDITLGFILCIISISVVERLVVRVNSSIIALKPYKSNMALISLLSILSFYLAFMSSIIITSLLFELIVDKTWFNKSERLSSK